MQTAIACWTLMLVGLLSQQPGSTNGRAICADASPACASAALGLLSQQQGSPSGASGSLDFGYFKTKVQPIFLAKRPGHARCVACHSSGTPLRLQALSPGSATWNDEESRKNFDAVKRVASPGNLKSKLLIHPLAEEAGGDFFHNGGKHFNSQDDQEWQTLKAFVLGQTAN